MQKVDALRAVSLTECQAEVDLETNTIINRINEENK